MVAWMTGGSQSPYVFVLGLAAMFAPTAAALIVQWRTDERPHVNWNRLPLTYLPAALFLMPLTLQAIILVRMSIVGPLPWQDWLRRRDGRDEPFVSDPPRLRLRLYQLPPTRRRHLPEPPTLADVAG
jgi:hypothetical protein